MSDITKKNILKYSVYIIILFLFYSIQTSPNLISINNISPNLIFSFSFFLCLFEGDVFFSSLYGGLTGLMLDNVSFTLMGFNGLILMCLFPITVYLYKKFLKFKFLNSFYTLFLSFIITEFFNFLFFYLIWYPINNFTIFNTFFYVLYTLLISPLLYKISKKLYEFFNV